MTSQACALTFLSVHDVIKAEKLVLAAGLRARLIPAPKQISPECGMALQIDCERLSKIEELLAPLQARRVGSFRIAGAAFEPLEG